MISCLTHKNIYENYFDVNLLFTFRWKLWRVFLATEEYVVVRIWADLKLHHQSNPAPYVSLCWGHHFTIIHSYNLRHYLLLIMWHHRCSFDSFHTDATSFITYLTVNTQEHQFSLCPLSHPVLVLIRNWGSKAVYWLAVVWRKGHTSK